jgi:TRAP-type uncharacterized transport system substrate-binding protein
MGNCYMTFRRTVLAMAAAAALSAPAAALAQAPQFFRIGTGSAGGTYYPIGGIIANAISCPPGAACGLAWSRLPRRPRAACRTPT